MSDTQRRAPSVRARLAAEIDLPLPTAVWVLGIHLVTILSPLLVVAAVLNEAERVDAALDRPALMHVYAVLLIVASVCESAQNTADRWYLVGVPRTLLDLVFGSLVVLALAVSVIAVAGDRVWVWVLALLVAAAFPVLYVAGRPVEPVQAVLGLASLALLVDATGEPIAALSALAVFLTLYFLDLLIRTRRQVFHGLTTGANIIGVAATAAALTWAGGATAVGWPLVLAAAVLVVIAAVLVRPALLGLAPTPRRGADRLEIR